MTVAIGAICDDGKSAVVAADKMVTFGAPMSLQTEPPTFQKIARLTEKTLLAFSGGVSDGEALITGALPQITAAPHQPVQDIAEAVKLSYIALKRLRAEENYLRPLLGADFQQFQALIAQSSSSQILQQVLMLISQHNLNLDALIVGADDAGTHLFAAIHPGQLLSVNTQGFAAIGSGGLHAAVRLSLAQHTKSTPLVETVYNVYEAKKAAEVAPGVGKMTDMAIVHDSKIFFVGQPLFAILEQCHKEKPALTEQEQTTLQEACNGLIGKAAGSA